MLSLTFEPTAKLTIDGESYYGINIVEKLHQLMKENPEAKELFNQAITIHQRITMPRLGFHLDSPSAVLPTKRIGDVGYDLTVVGIFSQPTMMTTLFETYIALQIPLGYYVELMPRSSLSKSGYMLANSVGIIDGGYTNSVKVPLIKVDPSMPDLVLPARVAQLILKPYVVSESYVVQQGEMIETTRGGGGFGSTG